MLEIVGLGVFAPALIALGVSCALRYVLPQDASRRFPAAIGFTAGFAAGYVLLPDWAALIPDRHWQWLPYLATAAGITGPIGNAHGVTPPERWLLMLLIAVAAGAVLVPTWPNLQPARPIWMAVVAGLLLASAALIDPLPRRVGGVQVAWSLCLGAFVVAALLAACISLTYARVAGAAAGSLAGVCLGCRSRECDTEIGALVPVALIVMGGMAFVGCIEPQQPVLGFLLLPAAPVWLWVQTLPPLRGLAGRSSIATIAALMLVPLALTALYVYYSV